MKSPARDMYAWCWRSWFRSGFLSSLVSLFRQVYELPLTVANAEHKLRTRCIFNRHHRSSIYDFSFLKLFHSKIEIDFRIWSIDAVFLSEFSDGRTNIFFA